MSAAAASKAKPSGLDPGNIIHAIWILQRMETITLPGPITSCLHSPCRADPPKVKCKVAVLV